MLSIAFQYDVTGDKWVQCLSEDYVHQDIEKLPYFLVLGNPDSEHFQGYSVLCPKHHRIEDVVEIQYNRVVSIDGCVFEGLIANEGFHTDSRNHLLSLYWESSYHDYCTEGILIPFRWRIFQREPNGPINIACDVAEIHHRKYLETGKFRHWHSFSISADIGKRRYHITPITKGRMLPATSWIDETGIRIPEIVADTAMEALRESTRLITGIKPSILSQMDKGEKLVAYVERPFDLNIVFLKNFLREYIKNAFDEAFPYDLKDNYRKICKYLDIKPPKSLRKAYTFNPYSIIWYMLFQQWGVKDVNLMQKFFYLDECITFLYLKKFYFDTETRRLERDYGDFQKEWHAMDHFCQWMLSQKGEKAFLRWLYRVSISDGAKEGQWETILTFDLYEQQLSEDIKKILLQDGLTQYVHDQICWEKEAYSKGLKNVRIYYDSSILAFECIVNGYEFHLMHDTRNLRHVGLTMRNFAATYRDDMLDRHSIIVAVRFKEKYVACIEIQNQQDIVRALGARNQRLTDNLLLVCRYWAKLNNLHIETDHLHLPNDSELIDLETAAVEAIPYCKSLEEMDVAELLSMSEDQLPTNYYHRLGIRLLSEAVYNVSPPPWINFADEREYLMYVLPDGERIYEAAANGNAEAQRTLGMMYWRGKAFQQNHKKAMEWLTKAVQQGDDEAKWEIDKLNKFISSKMTERDFEILQGLYKMRQRMAEDENCTIE